MAAPRISQPSAKQPCTYPEVKRTLPLPTLGRKRPRHTFTNRYVPRRLAESIMDLDLDGFEVGSTVVDDPSVGNNIATTGLDSQSALRYIDDHWYRERNRRGRQMDLIGDYAGTEPFVLDGNGHPSSAA